LALKAKEIYQSEKATVEEKRLLLSYIFSNLKHDNGKIKPNYTMAFEFLVNWMPKLNKNFEPEVNKKNKGANEVIAPNRSVWWAQQDLNL
jgi:hypothetical protein